MMFLVQIFWRNFRNYKSVDILDKNEVFELIASYKPDMIINLAARTDLDGKTRDYGVPKGPINISESMAEIKSEAMFIHFSSMLVCRMGHKPQDK